MDDSELLEYLKVLEMELHRPMCRSDNGRLQELLHDSFVEFGRGGIIYSKRSVIDELPEEDGSLNVFSRDYSLQLVQSNTALLFYRSAHIKSDGTPTDEFDTESV